MLLIDAACEVRSVSLSVMGSIYLNGSRFGQPANLFCRASFISVTSHPFMQTFPSSSSVIWLYIWMNDVACKGFSIDNFKGFSVSSISLPVSCQFLTRFFSLGALSRIRLTEFIFHIMFYIAIWPTLNIKWFKKISQLSWYCLKKNAIIFQNVEHIIGHVALKLAHDEKLGLICW